METQSKNKFDSITIKKILRGSLIAGGGVALIYLLEGLTALDFGQATPLVTGLAAILINMIKEFKKGEPTA